MAGKKTHVSKINEIKRLIGLELSNRVIANALGVGRNTVKKIREGAPLQLPVAPKSDANWVQLVPWCEVQKEVLKGVSLAVLWAEEVENGRVSVQYPAFWKQFDKRYPEPKSSMHRVFLPGARTEIDYCDGIDFYEPITGEVVKTHLFVGVLCHSRFVFAEFSRSQKSQDFLASHVRMFEFFGGVTDVISPDNLKSAVNKTHRYDPELNQAYARLAEHYEVAVVPARVRTPKDKAIVERSIQIFQKWFFASVRKRTFTSLVELNNCLHDHLDKFNCKIHRIFRRSRKDMFEYEKSSLKALPAAAYEVVTHSLARVHPDCHLAFEKNFYSAPEQLRGQQLDIWAGEKTIEIFHCGNRVAVHGRSKGHGLFITQKSHYPEAHRAYSEAVPEHLRQLSEGIGPETSALVGQMLAGETPLKNLRRVQGIIGLGKKYSKIQMEDACKTALKLNQMSCAFVEKFLKHRSGGPKPEKGTDPRTTAVERGANPLLRGNTLFH